MTKLVKRPVPAQVEMDFNTKSKAAKMFEAEGYIAVAPEFTKAELDAEEWRTIPGYKKYYAVSNLGRIKRLEHTFIDKIGRQKFQVEKIIDYRINKISRNIQVRLFHPEKGTYDNFLIQRLIYGVFNGDTDRAVYNKNHNKMDNRITNLSVDTGYASKRRTKKQKVTIDGVIYDSISEVAQKFSLTNTAVLFRCRSDNFKDWKYL
jgi:hypothetical protein